MEKCSVCGDVKSRTTKTVDPLGHDYQNGVCTRCGAADPNGNGGHPWAEKPEYKPSGASGTAAPEETPADKPEDTQAPADTDKPEETVAPEIEPEPETTTPADVEITTGGTGAVNGGSDEANPHTGAALGGIAVLALAGAAVLVSKKRK